MVPLVSILAVFDCTNVILAQVVQKLDSAIHQIYHYLVYNY